MGLSRAELLAHVGGGVDDILGTGTRLLIVGVNPGLWTAAVNAPYAHPGNRFWPALHASGLIDRDVDASRGLTAADRADLVRRGLGFTNLVARATVRADELRPDELREGARRVGRLAGRVRPRVVAVLGVTAYRLAFERRRARPGEQPVEDALGDAAVWVLPNPSGLNAHETIASIGEKLRAAGRAAGLVA